MHEVLYKDTIKPEVLPYLPVAKPGNARKRFKKIVSFR